MKKETTMKWGGFIVNSRLYQFFSKEHAFINHLLKGNGITRRGGFWNSFQSNKGGRRTGAAKRKGGVWWNLSNKDFRENLRGYNRGSGRKKGGQWWKGGGHHNKWVKYIPKRRKK